MLMSMTVLVFSVIERLLKKAGKFEISYGPFVVLIMASLAYNVIVEDIGGASYWYSLIIASISLSNFMTLSWQMQLYLRVFNFVALYVVLREPSTKDAIIQILLLRNLTLTHLLTIWMKYFLCCF